MSKSWTPDELAAASSAMKAAGHMSYEEFCAAPVLRLEYKGRDSWDRPVYECDGKLYVDVDPRKSKPADICTKQGNAFTATVYPRFELFVPNINACTSRCVRALGINQDLVLKRIFVLPRRTFQKSRPILIVGKAFADFVRQCRYILQLARHLISPPICQYARPI